MNAKLDKALEAAALLPDEDQQEIAEGILSYVELLQGGQVLLTPEQQAGVVEAQRDARAGQFATDDDVAIIWRKFGL